MTTKTVAWVAPEVNEWDGGEKGKTYGSREDLAWAAGLFEGEGCLAWGGKSARAIIALTDPDVLARFAAIVRVGTIISRKVPPGYKPQQVWSVQNREGVQAVVAALWPWLGSRRKARAIELLRLLQARPIANRLRTRCPAGHPYDVFSKRRQSRSCSVCRLESSRRFHAKRRALRDGAAA